MQEQLSLCKNKRKNEMKNIIDDSRSLRNTQDKEPLPYLPWFFFILSIETFSALSIFAGVWYVGVTLIALVTPALCSIVYSWTPTARKKRAELDESRKCIDDIVTLFINPCSDNKTKFSEKWPDYKRIALRNDLTTHVLFICLACIECEFDSVDDFCRGFDAMLLTADRHKVLQD